MQGLNSLSNQSSMSNESQQQLQQHIQNPNFDPPPSSTDDFLEQMLSSLPSCSWPDLKSSWDLPSSSPNPNPTFPKPPDHLSHETTPSDAFHSFDDSLLLASKLRQHQISGPGGGGGGGGSGAPSPSSAAKLLLQQQLMIAARGGLSQNDIVGGSSFNSPSQYNGFANGSMHGAVQPSNQHFNHLPPQNFTGAPAMNQPQGSASTGGAPAQPRQRVRARRGQATDPHSIAERLRRERIAERMKALQELVPNANKTDKASMLDEIIDYVKFLQLQVKVLSMSRLGGAAAVAPLVADISSEGGGDCIQANGGSSGPTRSSNPSNNNTQTTSSNDSLTVTEHQVAKLMEEDMGSAMQYLQGKGLCLMPISLATAISTATCHNRSPSITNRLLQPNADAPSSPSMSVLTVQSAATLGNGALDASVKDAASVSKP